MFASLLVQSSEIQVAPKDYAPEGTDAVEKEMFTFGGAPQMDLARAASEVQRETYENSALRQLMRTGPSLAQKKHKKK